MLGDDAAHDGAEIFAGFLVDEGVARFVPAELETGGKRGDPYFADGRVGRNHELGLLGFFEDNFEFSGFTFDVETVFIAGGVAKRIGAPHTLTIFGSLVLLGSLFFIFLVVMRLQQRPGASTAAPAND